MRSQTSLGETMPGSDGQNKLHYDDKEKNERKQSVDIFLCLLASQKELCCSLEMFHLVSFLSACIAMRDVPFLGIAYEQACSKQVRILKQVFADVRRANLPELYVSALVFLTEALYVG